MKTALLVTNRRPGDDAGRAEKVSARQRLFAERGWRVELSYVPEPYVLTFPLAVVRALRRCRAVDPDVLITMNNPFHMHLIGYAVAKLAGRPWVAEFRDPILTHPDWVPGSPLRWIAAAVERLTVRAADRVCWLDGIQIPEDYFASTYPDVPDERLVKLPYTGYDPSTFEGIAGDAGNTADRDADPFTIVYAGSFYEGWIEPFAFIEGLGRYLAETDAAVRARFYGDWDERYDAAAEAAGVAHAVVSHGFVPHEVAVRALVDADALLHVAGTDPDNRRNVPSKFGEYVAARQPIVTLADPSFRIADIVREKGLGVVADSDDPAAVRDAIAAVHTGEFVYDPEQGVIEEFSRARHADAYVEVLEDLVGA